MTADDVVGSHFSFWLLDKAEDYDILTVIIVPFYSRELSSPMVLAKSLEHTSNSVAVKRMKLGFVALTFPSVRKLFWEGAGQDARTGLHSMEPTYSSMFTKAI